jgi:hypothetical protein
MGNGTGPTPEFQRAVVQLARIDGSTRRENTENLEIVLSTLMQWPSREHQASEAEERPNGTLWLIEFERQQQ